MPRARAASADAMASSGIAVSIDLDAPGKRIGHLELAWSDDEHAYGIIPVPIAVIAHGAGPSALSPPVFTATSTRARSSPAGCWRRCRRMT